MKFGKELDKRSVLKWKHNNIHYNDLKFKIKVATTLSHDSVSSESSSTMTTVNTVDGRHRSSLKILYQTFGKEIEFISLFVNTENSKNSHQLINLRYKIELLLSKYYSPNQGDKSKSFDNIKKANFIRCCNEANALLENLNDLSQFINLQKLLLRKLFKKFLKYSSLSNKHEFVDHIKDKYLEGNISSFVNVDLNDLIQELSLIIDVLNSINENKKITFPVSSPIDNTLSKVVKFDIVSQTRGVFKNSFLIHNDNLSELKLKLLKEFDLVCDDEGKNDLNYLKKTSSHLSLQHTAKSINTSPEPTTTSSRREYFQPDSEIAVSILGPPVLSPTHSSLTLINDDEYLLVAKVGGFKNISYTKISRQMLSVLTDNILDRDTKATELRKLVNPSHDLISINWALSTTLEPIHQLKFKRIRFISYAGKQPFYITLDANIETSTPAYNFPYSVLTISYEDVISYPENINDLIGSHLVYQMPLEFSLVNFLNLKFYLPGEEKPEWFYDIESVKDIKKMPPQTIRAQEPPRSILLNKNDSEAPRRQRTKYWNEFDNGSDFEDADDAFYVYGSSTIGDEEQQLLSPTKVNNILKFSNKVVDAFQYLLDTKEEPKIYRKQSSYGSFDSDTENDEVNESDEDLSSLSRFRSPPFNSPMKNKNNKIFLQKLQYDKVLTFLYFFIMFSSVLLIGISIGILYTLLANSLANSSLLLIFIFACFFLGLILSITAICLINTRYNEPPKWHYFMNYFVLFLNLSVICLGIKLVNPYLV